MVDANQRWGVQEAIEWMKKLSSFNITWIEEPTSPDDILGHLAISQVTIVGFTLTVGNDFLRFLSQFPTNFHEILHTLFSIHVVTTLKVSRSCDKYF